MGCGFKPSYVGPCELDPKSLSLGMLVVPMKTPSLINEDSKSYILYVSNDELDNPPIPFLTPKMKSINLLKLLVNPPSPFSTPKTKSVNLLKLLVNPPGPFSTPKMKSVNILRQHQMVCLKALI